MNSNLSDYILGLWRMDSWNRSAKENLSYLKECVELGVTTLDQANIYGWEPSCEELLGQALSIDPNFRDQIQIISKFNIYAHNLPQAHAKHYNTSYKSVIESVELSLKRMRIETLDVLLIHRLDYLMNADEVARAFQHLKETGKVQYFGVSNFSTSQFNLLQSRLNFPLITNQLELNPLRFSCLEDGTLDQCQQHRIRPMAWSPLAGGELFTSNPSEQAHLVIKTLSELGKELDTTIDQVAAAWVQKHPSNPHIILGTKEINNVKSALSSQEITLTNEQWYRVWTAATGKDVP